MLDFLISLQKFVWKLIRFAFAGSIPLFFLGIFRADEDISIRACLQDAVTVTGVSQASEKLWEAELELTLPFGPREVLLS